MRIRALLLALLARDAAGTLTCLDESGRSVDWWFLYKHPRWADKSRSVCVGDCSGSTYVYTTSASSGWKQGGARVNETGSLLGVQTAAIYAGGAGSYVFYNDQLPDGQWTLEYGHSKGFFAFDADSAFWVQHSIPKFPNYVADGYEYGQGQMYYGQHAFCMTINPKELNAAAGVMKYAYPWVYDHAFAAGAPQLPNVSAVVAGTQLNGSTSEVISTSWADLTLLGKSASLDVDMLDAIVSPQLKEGLNGQSWLNSGGPLGSQCPQKGYDVLDVMQISLPPDDSHVTYEDHSKWAVANSSGSDWFCALDNNHVASQEIRSGLAVCFRNSPLAKLMRDAVKDTSSCGSPHPPPPPPSPSNCCYYGEASCHAGQTCCSESGKSYSSEDTCKRYGSKHHCVWDSGTCHIPTAAAAVGAEREVDAEAMAEAEAYGAKHHCVWDGAVCRPATTASSTPVRAV